MLRLKFGDMVFGLEPSLFKIHTALVTVMAVVEIGVDKVEINK